MYLLSINLSICHLIIPVITLPTIYIIVVLSNPFSQSIKHINGLWPINQRELIRQPALIVPQRGVSVERGVKQIDRNVVACHSRVHQSSVPAQCFLILYSFPSIPKTVDESNRYYILVACSMVQGCPSVSVFLIYRGVELLIDFRKKRVNLYLPLFSVALEAADFHERCHPRGVNLVIDIL